MESKKEILLDLSDIAKTAAVCKTLSSEVRLEILRCLVEQSMSISELAQKFMLPMSSICLHIKLLHEAGLISVVPRPGLRGSQKLCGIQASHISVDLFKHTTFLATRPSSYVHMPIGNYTNCDIYPPCGIVSNSEYLYYEDSPYGFFSPNRTSASLIWFSKGFVEYQFSNYMLSQDTPTQIEFSFEICSEAPGYNNNWPSDILVEINHITVASFTTKGDYGGRKGTYNPSWWSESNSQYGELKQLFIRNDGCYMDNIKVSDETITSLNLQNGYYILFCLRVNEQGNHVGGMNLFGQNFGDYSQDIVMRVDYV